MEVDRALSLLGSYGRWQMTYFVILSVGMMFPAAWHTLGYIFQAYTPPHHCHVTDVGNVPGRMQRENVTLSRIPWNNVTQTYSSCYVYDDDNNNSIDSTRRQNKTMRRQRQCSDDVNKWDYFGDVTDTIVSEWNLVCDRAFMKKTTSSVVGLGTMFGMAVFPPLSDLFGRRIVFLSAHLLMVVVGVCNAFVHDYYLYVALRFLVGFFRPGFGITAFILACELFPAKHRTFVGIIIENFWALAVCFLALFMYLITNWRHLQLVISLFGLLAIPLYCYLPESVPWLISKGRLDEAEKTIQRAARTNRIKDFPSPVFTAQANQNEGVVITLEHYENDVVDTEKKYRSWFVRIFQKTSTKKTEYTMIDVLRHRRLRHFLIVTSILLFVNSTVYYGMTLNTEELAGNRHLNLFLTGIFEIPAYTISFFIANRFGRRLPLVVFHVLAGVFLVVSQIIPLQTVAGFSLLALRTAFTMLGKFCITASFGIAYIYTPELFPTTVRTQSTGLAAICSRFGFMLAPFATSLNAWMPWMSAVVFGLVSIVGGLFALTLPETNKRPLPQTIDDIQHWYKAPNEQLSKRESKNGNEEVNRMHRITLPPSTVADATA